MMCSNVGCPGAYEPKAILHTIRHRGEVVVIDQVPAEVCNVCGDVLFSPETVRRIEGILELRGQAQGAAPIYEFANR